MGVEGAGLVEGDECPYCEHGILQIKPVEACSCHINPPCAACVEAPLLCNACGTEIESMEE